MCTKYKLILPLVQHEDMLNPMGWYSVKYRTVGELSILGHNQLGDSLASYRINTILTSVIMELKRN